MNKSEITIKETIERYSALRDDVAGSAFKDMLERTKEIAKEGEYVNNDTYFHALFLTEMMLTNTNNSLRILAGCDIVRFLKALQSTFIDTCRRIAATGGSIKIVALTSSKKHLDTCFDSLSEFFKETKEFCPEISGKMTAIVKVLPKTIAGAVESGSNHDISHYIVCDSKMIRIEEPHGVLKLEAPASLIKARVYFNAPNTSKAVVDSFDNSYFKNRDGSK